MNPIALNDFQRDRARVLDAMLHADGM